MVFYAAFNSISVISWWQLILFMLSWVSPVLSWVSVMDWPAKSPDLIPIEQVWDELGCHVRRNHATKCKRPCSGLTSWVGQFICAVYKYSVTLTACATVWQRALHKMVDKRYRHIPLNLQYLFELIPPPNEFKPLLLCNCVLQNQVWFWKLNHMWYHSILFNERIIAATSNFQIMSAKNNSLLQI